MATLNISIPKGYQNAKDLEIIAKFNKIDVALAESPDAVLPSLVLPDKTEVSGIVPISYALARTTKANGKNWARTVLGDGVPARAAEIEQYSSIAESVFGSKVLDIKSTIGQISTHLKSCSFVASPSELTMADVLLALALYPAAQQFTNEEREKSFVDLVRWLIFINNLLGNPLPQLPVPNIEFKFGSNKQNQNAHKPAPGPKQPGQQPAEGKGKKAQKKPQQNAPKQEEDTRDPFSWIDVRIGKIVKVWPHPNADTLYCEEIDVGNGVIKHVVTGVRNYVPIEEMQDRHVVVFCNIKPSKIRGQPSESMVFAGSNADHSVVELLDPPADAPIGTRIVCGDFVQGEVPGVDKKGKYWEAVSANHNLSINADHLACYKGVPLSCEYGQIRVKTLANCEFH
ncbi:hypothetical protein M9Y10_045906 [Tritrichomonas musculus]|uniref:tRNA-binding domain-containing protein n=1 Tax=Tritrichomonas musculus TaxID=1915356 RepID=A0ABR2JWN8_9EUKA